MKVYLVRIGVIFIILLSGIEIGIRGIPWLNDHLDYKKIMKLGWNLEEHTNVFNNNEDKESIKKFDNCGVYARKKPSGVYRIVCIGSSSTAGIGSSDLCRYDFPSQLERILDERSPGKVEVINGSIPAAPLYMIRVYLEEVLLPMNPDLVILYFGANGDLPEVRPFYERLKSEKKQAPFIRSNEGMWAAVHLRWNPPWMIRGFLTCCRIRSFMAVVVLMDKIRKQPLPVDEGGALDFHILKDGGSFAEGDKNIIEGFFSQSIEEIVKLCVGQGKKISLIPELILQNILQGTIPDYYDLFRRNADRYVRDGVYFKDLSDSFSPDIASLYFVEEMHMNDRGYLRLAEQITRYLSEEELIPL
ncbi:SGNH/GDSL hydrolase family protein [Thermodesulfobacteriota bacterium]